MKLETSVELLERVRAKHHASWWALQKVIPVSESTVNNWKHGRSTIDRRFVPRIAELLEEPPEYVLACVENERTPDAEVQKLWHRIATKFRTRAASVLFVLCLLAGLVSPTRSEAYAPAAEGSCAESVYYGKSRWKQRRRRRRPLLQRKTSVFLDCSGNAK